MRCLRLIPAALVVFSTVFAASQQSPSPKPSDGLELLKSVAKRYADAKSYAVSATEEMTQTDEYQRMWNKTMMAAAEAPGGRYYFEGRGTAGGAVRVSDGKTAWKYQIEENHYTAQPAAAANPPGGVQVMAVSEAVLMNAQYLRTGLGNMARTLRSASIYPEETIAVDGKPVACLVVRIRDSDENRPHPGGEMEETIWIDKQQQTIVKTERREEIRRFNGPAGRSLRQVATTTYTKTELDGAIPDSVFAFVPPAGAVLVADFPDPRDAWGGSSMAGDMVPALKFKSADGKSASIESFRGRPVLIDFWATWCAPCVAAMPKLAEMYKEGKDKGLVLLSVDQDEDAAKAAEFMAKKGYAWPNYHDGDGEIEKLMGATPIPRVVLVDAKGQIAYDGTGGDENRLRAHLSQLGPEFRDLAPKAPSSQPCVAAK